MTRPPDLPVFGQAPADAVLHPRAGAYAVVRAPDRRVAVVRLAIEGTEQCWLPGGGLEPGETPEAALMREVKEELGLAVGRMEPLAAAIQHFRAPQEARWYRMLATFFRVELGEPLAVPGAFRLEWISPERDAESFFHASHVWASTLE